MKDKQQILESMTEMFRNYSFFLLLVCTSFNVLLVRDSTCFAHPFHTSLTEMDWNAKKGCWEVGLRVFANDLELAVQHKFEGKLNLEDQTLGSVEVSKHLQDYLSGRLHLTAIKPSMDSSKLDNSSFDASPVSIQGGIALPLHGRDPAQNRASEIRWVGSEFEGSWVWLYFELVPTVSDRDLILVHDLLVDVNDDQLNVISVRDGRRKFSAQTHSQQTWISLKPDVTRTLHDAKTTIER